MTEQTPAEVVALSAKHEVDFLPPPERLVLVRTGSGAGASRGKKKAGSRSRGRAQSK
jgi:hypothetical protein